MATVCGSPPEGFHLAHERLEVYPTELSFVAWVTDLLEEAPGDKEREEEKENH